MDKRLQELAEVIIAYSKHDFDPKVEISPDNDIVDGIAAGINMLGEELQGASISLSEKNILIKEVHHRVKNNLQLISSLINLQMSFVDDDEVVEKLKDCQSRIKSMALVHEKLYQSKDLSSVNIGEYISILVEEIENAYGSGVKNIELICNLEQEINITLDNTVTCGLVLNELLTNAYKHAFDENAEAPKILIELKQVGEEIQLSVADNGKGISGGLPLENSDSMGMLVLHSLAEQMEAHIDAQTENGTRVSFTFRKNASQ